MCPDCEVLRTPRSRHCAICNKCVERFDHHCPWINNCVGIHNHNWFMAFLWSLTIILTIISVNCLWGSIAPCGISNSIEDCPLSELCFNDLCKNKVLKDTVAVATIGIALFFGLPVAYLSYIVCRNYSMNKTTNERFSRAARSNSTGSELSSASSFQSKISSVGDEVLLPGGPGGGRGRRRKTCCSNFAMMCCPKRVTTQQ